MMPVSRLNRFGISTLSLKNKEEALNEELMSIKELGIQYMKTPEGDIISFDKMAREKAHSQHVINYMMSLGMYGKVSMLQFPYNTPKIIEYGEDLAGDNGILLTLSNQDKPKKIYLSLDIESLSFADKEETVVIENQPIVHCVIHRVDDRMVSLEKFTIDRELNEFNNNTIYVGEYMPSHNLMISELSISENPLNKDAELSLRHVLYSAIVAYE